MLQWFHAWSASEEPKSCRLSSVKAKKCPCYDWCNYDFHSFYYRLTSFHGQSQQSTCKRLAQSVCTSGENVLRGRKSVLYDLFRFYFCVFLSRQCELYLRYGAYRWGTKKLPIKTKNVANRMNWQVVDPKGTLHTDKSSRLSLSGMPEHK